MSEETAKENEAPGMVVGIGVSVGSGVGDVVAVGVLDA